jgi:hypothetical protein
LLGGRLGLAAAGRREFDEDGHELGLASCVLKELDRRHGTAIRSEPLDRRKQSHQNRPVDVGAFAEILPHHPRIRQADPCYGATEHLAPTFE